MSSNQKGINTQANTQSGAEFEAKIAADLDRILSGFTGSKSEAIPILQQMPLNG